jgi:hypothetical protein
MSDLEDAFNVHAALVAVEAKRPHLKDNPRWRLIRMGAYEAYYLAMAGQAL